MNSTIIFQPIGHTRSGLLVKIPLTLSVPGLEVYLNAFSIDDLVDIFCMIEYLAFQYQRTSNLAKNLKKSIKLLRHIFDTFKNETYFGDLLQTYNLESLAARVEMGVKLVLPEFRSTI